MSSSPKKLLRRKKANPEGQMSLVEHLQELRRRLIISMIALAVGTVIGFIWYQHSAFGVSSLGDILRGPYCSLPPEKRATFTLDGECRLIATAPFEALLLRLKVGALAGAVFASPVWLYQIWAFITPGLMKNERKWTFTFVSVAVLLFVSGAVLAYFVVEFGLEFLLGIGAEFQVTALSGGRYFDFLLALLAIFGVSFEVPLIIAMLNVAGVLSYEAIKDKRSIIIMLLFIFAAVMTPGQDPFSMLVLALALTILVEISIQFTRLNDKRRKVERPDWLDTDDEQASPLATQAAPIAPSGPITPSASPTTIEGSNYDDII
ncbi:MAG: twin-arginine translocase subunit TatC [Corynebacterium sp.]|uniref:twin-arginine translocase subunit TatC n=1 Tax=Corynebacterium sp. TaxID=1720 RepID=UPI0026DBBB28|nr:twin-arginine translocase subunit TatC [Corynebacterium sp.]MDO5098214.1 twin-arginine translocase subunit TatC [Corynebacterium sp.]